MSDGQWMQTNVNAMIDALKQAGDRYSLPLEPATNTEHAHAPYECGYCTSQYSSVSAMLACELSCARDRGRE